MDAPSRLCVCVWVGGSVFGGWMMDGWWSKVGQRGTEGGQSVTPPEPAVEGRSGNIGHVLSAPQRWPSHQTVTKVEPWQQDKVPHTEPRRS